MLVLFFSNGTKRYAHFSNNESYWEDIFRVKNTLGKDWKLTSIDTTVQIGGIMYESTNVDERECLLSKLESLEEDYKKLLDLILAYKQHP